MLGCASPVCIAVWAVLLLVVVAAAAGAASAAAASGAGAKPDSFRGWTQYRPACSGQWLSDRRGECTGLTTGEMPAVDSAELPGLCCGSLGVPPEISTGSA